MFFGTQRLQEPAAIRRRSVKLLSQHRLERCVIEVRRDHRAAERALLNFGHTFGHAIETGIGYGEWLHGEAVAAGMVTAANLSARLGWIEEDEVARLAALLERAALPIAPPRMDVAQWLTLLGRDKKVERGQLRLVLLRALGHAVIVADVDRKMLEAVLRG